MLEKRWNTISTTRKQVDQSKRFEKILAKADTPRVLSIIERKALKDAKQKEYQIRQIDKSFLVKQEPLYKRDIDTITFQIAQHFRSNLEHDVPLNISGLAIELGVDRETLLKYSRGEQRVASDGLQVIIKKAYTVCENYYTNRLHSKDVMGSMFWLKSHGWQGEDKGNTININFGDIVRNVMKDEDKFKKKKSVDISASSLKELK